LLVEGVQILLLVEFVVDLVCGYNLLKEFNMSERKKVCMLCGKPSEESICETCKNNVQGEALKKKKHMEKGSHNKCIERS